jgi:hypothetical protein
MAICTLGHVEGGGYLVEGYHDSCWLMGLWSTQAKVEGMCRRLRGTGVINSSVQNDPFGESGHTPLYGGLPSVWCSADGDHISFPVKE